MKAEEIRKLELVPPDTVHPGEPVFLDESFFLQEIAAQLADLNERLDGFMGSMVQLAKAINELNAELLKSGKAEKQLLDGIHKWIGSLRLIGGSNDQWQSGYDRAVTDVKREFVALFMPDQKAQS